MPNSRSITNDKLQSTDVPPPDADWDVLNTFALSFAGYEVLGSFEACAEIANARKHDTLTHLRTCLFFEQRRWRHFAEYPDSETMSYIRGIIEQIRHKVASEDRQ
jgi:hypothetical protein